MKTPASCSNIEHHSNEEVNARLRPMTRENIKRANRNMPNKNGDDATRHNLCSNYLCLFTSAATAHSPNSL